MSCLLPALITGYVAAYSTYQLEFICIFYSSKIKNYLNILLINDLMAASGGFFVCNEIGVGTKSL